MKQIYAFLALLAFAPLLCAQAPQLPAANTKHKVKNFSRVIGWKDGKTPTAPAGFQVNKFADGFDNPRWIYVGPNGDIFISEAETTNKNLFKKIGNKAMSAAKGQNVESSSNRITLLRGMKADGTPESRHIFLTDLNQPFGMLILGNWFYVANTDGLWRYPYKVGQTSITAKGEMIKELPAGGYNNHWTRNIISNPKGTKIYISVGSGSNSAENGMENEVRRAAVLEINPDGTKERIFAEGLRNPVGLAWEPTKQTLWTVVNERDNLGDDLVPDYLTQVDDGGFYGWPFAYFGPNEDPNHKDEKPELVMKTKVPDLELGAHTASLGLAFYNQKVFPNEYHGGAFIGQHGSWNRTELSGYKVVFVPFKNGKPSSAAKDFLTGFISDIKKSHVYGRPVGVAVLNDGSLLVADDSSNTLWRVSAQK